MPGFGDEHNHYLGANCGSFYCAKSEVDAENQTGAAGDSALSCVSSLPTWTACLTTTCNACDDGAGGMLQSNGEHCAGDDENTAPPGGYSCCHGLTCVGATATEMGACVGTLLCTQAPPNLVPLTTTRLRAIAAAQNIGAGQSGITQSRTIGLAFENWVLVTMGQIPRNTVLFPSQLRQKANQSKGGLPGSVIPEYVAGLDKWWPAQGWSGFPQSLFFEVKAVTGVIAMNTSQYQILGLVDVLSSSFGDAGTHPPPALVFTTTGNTNLALSMLQQATQSGVAIWQQLVMEDTNTDPSNPDLYIDQLLPANQDVYNVAVPLPMHPVWPHSPLTSPTSPPMPVPNDPDPPEVD